MKVKTIMQYLVLLAFMSPVFSYCQKANSSKILRTWIFTKLEFTKPFADSTNLSNNLNGMILTLEKDGIIQIKRKIGNESKVEHSGTYSISEDGKTFFQNGAAAEIVLLTHEEFATKVETEGFVTYFKRVPDEN